MVVEVETLQRENAELRSRVDSLLLRLDSFSQQIAKLNERLAELLAAAGRKRRKTPKDKPAAPAPDVSVDTQAAFDARPTPPALPEKTKAPKSKRTWPKRQRRRLTWREKNSERIDS